VGNRKKGFQDWRVRNNRAGHCRRDNNLKRGGEKRVLKNRRFDAHEPKRLRNGKTKNTDDRSKGGVKDWWTERWKIVKEQGGQKERTKTETCTGSLKWGKEMARGDIPKMRRKIPKTKF